MIDPNNLATAAALAGIATIGGLVIVAIVPRRPRPHVRPEGDGYSYSWSGADPENPLSVTIYPDPASRNWDGSPPPPMTEEAFRREFVAEFPPPGVDYRVEHDGSVTREPTLSDRGPLPSATPMSERHPKPFIFSGTIGERGLEPEDEGDVEVFVADEDALRFFVGHKPDRQGFWRLRDRANFREVPGKLYTTRRSALRGAQRLNAKEPAR